MAYSANGNNFPSKNLSRVKYDLIVREVDSYIQFKGPAPEIIKIAINTGEEALFFGASPTYAPIYFNPTSLNYIYGDQIFLDVARQRNFIWVNTTLTGDCLITMLLFINNSYMTNDTTINLVADTDYPYSNPFTGNAIPRMVDVLASDGTEILDAYININQSTGNIIIYVGANYTNAILNIIGW